MSASGLRPFGVLFYDEPEGTPDIVIDLEDETGRNYLSIAAFLLGAAADKAGEITVDLVVYENAILGIPSPPADGQRFYFDYSGFTYDRGTTFPGCVIYAVTDGSELGWTDPPVSLMDAVFGGADTPDGLSNVAAFAQMADDARAVIEFLHSHLIYDEVDLYGADPIGESDVCSASVGSPTVQILTLPVDNQPRRGR